jgi:hypothetical protein
MLHNRGRSPARRWSSTAICYTDRCLVPATKGMRRALVNHYMSAESLLPWFHLPRTRRWACLIIETSAWSQVKTPTHRTERLIRYTRTYGQTAMAAVPARHEVLPS